MRRGRRITALAIVVGAVLSAPSAALAATTPTAAVALSESLNVRRVDTTKFPAVKIEALAVGGKGSPTFTVAENGRTVTAQSQTWVKAGVPLGTVLVIDTAGSMTQGDRLIKAQAAAKFYVAQKPANELVAIVAAGAAPRVVINFTADVGQLSSAIDHLAPEGEQALYDALRLSAALFTARPELIANVIVVSNGSDKLSATTGGIAQATLQASKASVYTIGLPGSADYSASILRALAVGGGQYIEVRDPAGLAAALSVVHDAQQRGVELSYASHSTATSALAITVAAHGRQVLIHTVAGAVSVGSNAVPSTHTLTQAPGLLRNKAGVLLIALMVLFAAGLFTFAVLALVGNETSTLERALQPYDENRPRVSEFDDEEDTVFAQTALVSRAVEATGRFAEQQGMLERVETMLEQADLALRPAEALFFYLVGVLIVVISVVALQGLIIGLIAMVIVGLIPPSVLSFLAKRRLRQFNSQLPDTLQLLASSLRAGFSFLQGVEAVSEESRKPMGDELRRVIIEARLGRPMEEALQDCADRMKSPDFDWAVMAVRIQREVGGNLAELLQTVGETMIERERLRRDVKSLTAEGRVSAIVLGIMPPALGAVFYVTNPKYMNVLFTHTGGQIALGVAVVAGIIGVFWMKKVVDIEV